LSSAEKESFVKSFLIFFISLSLASSLVFWFEYSQKKHLLEEAVFNEMKLCSLDLKCKQFTFDFTSLDADISYNLKKDTAGYYALFSIPSDKYALKLHFSQKLFDARLAKIFNTLFQYFLFTLVCLAVLSAIFSFYALYPLKKALNLTEEFSRDMIHDLNTPLSSLRLNTSLLKTSPSEAKKIKRIEQSIETIVLLGNNLKSYLGSQPSQKEIFDLRRLLKERVSILQYSFSNVAFIFDDVSDTIVLNTNRDAITIVIDNILGNAAKYSKDKGTVWIDIDAISKVLHINDDGIGIKEPKRIFERFYKEHERGLGIGLHVVKKICDDLGIQIDVKSIVGQGSQFSFDFSSLTLR
jgi:signal transduction histidine kinase